MKISQRRADDPDRFLHPFEAHGVIFTRKHGGQAVAACPFCDKEDHFFVNSETGQWDCKVCGRDGNIPTFLNQMVLACRDNATEDDWAVAAYDRSVTKISGQLVEGVIPVSALKATGMVIDGTDRWLIPVRNANNGIADIQIWRPRTEEQRGHKPLATKGCHTGLFNGHLLGDAARDKEPVYIVEGFGDMLTLQWVLSSLKLPGVVVGKPGAGVFKLEWRAWFKGRDVFLCDDNDPAGRAGTLKTFTALSGLAKSRKCLQWPVLRPEGYDLRDYFLEATRFSPKGPGIRAAWAELQTAFHDSPASAGVASETNAQLSPRLTLGPGEFLDTITEVSRTAPVPTLNEVIGTYKRWLEVDAEFEKAIKLVLAVAITNFLPGGKDPVWMFLVSPSGSGKTALLMSLEKVEYCHFESTIGPHTLISGFKAKEDPSLLPKLDGKVFVLKDYTEIMAMDPLSQDQVLGVLRGAYDGSAKRQYGNGEQREYHTHFSMLAGVTNAIHGNTRASLGERFLKFQMIKGVKVNAERAVERALLKIGSEALMQEEITGIVARFLHQKIDINPRMVETMMPREYITRLVSLVHVVAPVRAEVSREKFGNRDITARPQAELPTRLSIQLAKLAIGLCLIEGKATVDDAVYDLVERVAFDSAIGFHLDVVEVLMQMGGSATIPALAQATSLPRTSLIRQLEDLTLLGVVRKDEGDRGEPGEDTGGGLVTAGILRKATGSLYRITDEIRRHWSLAKIGHHASRTLPSRRTRSTRLEQHEIED